MDSAHIIERIENGELSFQEELGAVKVRVELEAADKLGVLLQRLHVDLGTKPRDVKGVLRTQSAAIVDRLDYIDAMRILEIDGISNAVQIRSDKPTEDGFIEVMLRGGNSISFERRGSALHISKKDLGRLVSDLTDL